MTDITVTVLLYCNFKLRTAASRRTDHMLKKLKIFIIERGLLTTVAQLLEISAYLASLNPNANQFLWLVFQFIDSKIYVNSLLALLNARNHLRGIGSSVQCTSTAYTAEEPGGSQLRHSTVLELDTIHVQEPTSAAEGRGRDRFDHHKRRSRRDI
ncbi:hypothetical protein WOLCODRAFT_27857 [Wolfiporia cocos MD-104 SS10]|uniref:DUF6534 domain-containing protein n=1 Tax=Wolfiporia cocos (strain MD-104) TaxID=742152 RepID=A0A2H3JCD2_WOLCO|nr:hypothetical protein WOLCODRAFT_27857 [Wolfiporia cocos MD-104 SS10]